MNRLSSKVRDSFSVHGLGSDSNRDGLPDSQFMILELGPTVGVPTPDGRSTLVRSVWVGFEANDWVRVVNLLIKS